MTQYYLKEPVKQNEKNPIGVTKWGMYNSHLQKPTGIRIAGSAMLSSFNAQLQGELQDIVGFFLISKPGLRYTPKYFHLERYQHPVFVKGRYTGIVLAAYPGLNVISVEDVEEAVIGSEKGSIGLEIVQSGDTVRHKGLVLHGLPLFLSESLFVVDYDRYRKNSALQQIIQSLQPVGYFEDQRLLQFARWYFALEQNLGKAWNEKPSITELFCRPEEIEEGLRPYRLKTRNWKPDLHYKRAEAEALVQSAQKKLLHYYQQLTEKSLSSLSPCLQQID